MALKIPPPPPLANVDQAFNRWLLELTSILANSGGLSPDAIDGYPALVLQVAASAAAITILQGQVGGQSGSIAALQAQVTTLTLDLAAADNNITILLARPQVLNGVVDPAAGLGNVDDWYANTIGAAGHRIFVKTGVATWTAFPF